MVIGADHGWTSVKVSLRHKDLRFSPFSRSSIKRNIGVEGGLVCQLN